MKKLGSARRHWPLRSAFEKPIVSKFSKRLQTVEGTETAELSLRSKRALDDANAALARADNVEATAGLEERSSKGAIHKSDKAAEGATNAMGFATNVRQEAD